MLGLLPKLDENCGREEAICVRSVGSAAQNVSVFRVDSRLARLKRVSTNLKTFGIDDRLHRLNNVTDR